MTDFDLGRDLGETAPSPDVAKRPESPAPAEPDTSSSAVTARALSQLGAGLPAASGASRIQRSVAIGPVGPITRSSAPVIRRWGKTKTDEQFWAELEKDIEKKAASLGKQLEKDFGVNGMRRGFTKRSPEALAWRGRMKEAARVKARSDVDETLDNYDETEEGNRSLLATEKAYYRISAKKKVYSESKDSVKKVMSEAVDDVFDEVWTANKPFGEAVQKYFGHLRNTPGDFSGARAVAKRSVADRFTTAKEEGRTAKRIAFGKEQAAAGQSAAVTSAAGIMDLGASGGQGGQGLIAQSEYQVSAVDKVGQKAVKETIEADSVEKGMGIFGTLLDNVVGSSGDQVSLAVEFKVPLEGFYIAFTLTGKAARGIDGAMTAGVPKFGDPRRLEVMAEIKFRIGTGVPDLLDIGADFSLFVRGGANDTALCMKTLSYGAYRRLGAVSDTAANWWAGAGKGVDEGKAVRAESWAAMIEEQAFKEDDEGKGGGAFVDVGGGFGVSGEVTLGGDDLFGGAGAGGGVAAFHSYNHDALKDSLKGDYASVVQDYYDQSGQLVTAKDVAKRRRKNVKGSAGAAYNVNGKASFRIPGVGGVEIAGTLSGSITQPKNFGIEITGTLSYKGDATSMIEQWAAGYATAVADILKSYPKLVKPFFTDRADWGGFVEASAATTQAVNAGLGNTITKGLAEALPKVAAGPASGAAALVTSSSLQVALIGGCDGKKPIFRIEIRSGRKLEVNTPMAGAAGVKITGEKTSRLLALGIDGGKVDAEIFGVRARGKTNQRGKKHRL